MFYVVGNYAYLTSYNEKALEIVDVSNPAAPIHKSSIRSSAGGAKLDGAMKVFVAGNYAYVLSSVYGSNGLEIVNVSDPATPVHEGFIKSGDGGATWNYPTSVFVSGRYAYITSGWSNLLEIVDVSNTSAPVHIANLTNNNGGANLSSPSSIYVSGNYAYITSSGGNALEIVDISNPAVPIHKGKIFNTANGAKLSNPSSVFISGNYAYVASTGSNALEVVDVLNKASPVHKGSIKDGDGTGASLLNTDIVYVSGDYAYLASVIRKTLEIVDISNPAAPIHKGTIKSGDLGAKLDSPTSIFVSGKYAYVTDSSNYALEIVDVSNPSTPLHKGSIAYEDGEGPLFYPTSVFVSGNNAFVADGGNDMSILGSLEIFDVSNPTSPTHIGSLKNGVGGAKLSSPNSVYVLGGYAYLASSSSNALEIVNVSNPAAPTHKGSISHNPGGALLDSPYCVFVSGNYAYITSIWSDSLEVVDVSNPALPVHKGSIINGTGGASLSSPMSVYVSGNYAYVTDSSKNCLEVVNISNPALPVHQAKIVDGTGGAKLSEPYSVFVSGSYAYIASSGSNALEIIDINPHMPPSIAPSSGPNTATLLVTITGKNFANGAIVNLTNASYTIPGSVSFINRTTIRCTFPLNGAPPWVYDLNIRNPDNRTTTVAQAFTVTNISPTITSITPSSAFNSSIIPVTIVGTAFRNGVTVSLTNGSMIILGTITNRTTTKLLCTFPLNGTPAGIYNLTALNIDGSSTTKANAFTVNPSGDYPVITEFNPGTGVNNASLPFTINGSGFRSGATITITNRSTTKTIAATSVRNDQIKCSLPLTGIAIGLYNLTVKNPNGTAGTVENGFTVTNPVPSITTISPATGFNTSSIALAISGTNFVAGLETVLVNESTTINGTVAGLSSTKFTGSFNLSGSPAGLYNLTVTNPGGSSGTKKSCFNLSAPNYLPNITSLSPDAGVNNASLLFTINGSGFRPKAVVTITNNSTTKTVLSTSLTSGQITCTLPLTGLSIGLYNVTVRNTDGSSDTWVNGFTITNPVPSITTLSPGSGFNTGTVAIAISGTRFVPGLQAVLENESSSITGTVTGYTATKFTGTFNLTGYPPAGLYNLTVTNPGGSIFNEKELFQSLSSRK